MILYALLVTKSRRVDRHEKKKAGYIFLQEDAPPGHQLYAVVVDTGFRSPAHCSAKVSRSPRDLRSLLCKGVDGVSDGPRHAPRGDWPFQLPHLPPSRVRGSSATVMFSLVHACASPHHPQGRPLRPLSLSTLSVENSPHVQPCVRQKDRRMRGADPGL